MFTHYDEDTINDINEEGKKETYDKDYWAYDEARDNADTF